MGTDIKTLKAELFDIRMQMESLQLQFQEASKKLNEAYEGKMKELVAAINEDSKIREGQEE